MPVLAIGYQQLYRYTGIDIPEIYRIAMPFVTLTRSTALRASTDKGLKA